MFGGNLSHHQLSDLVIILLVVEWHHWGLGVGDPGDGGHAVRDLLHHSALVHLREEIEARTVSTRTQASPWCQQRWSSWAKSRNMKRRPPRSKQGHSSCSRRWWNKRHSPWSRRHQGNSSWVNCLMVGYLRNRKKTRLFQMFPYCCWQIASVELDRLLHCVG